MTGADGGREKIDLWPSFGSALAQPGHDKGAPCARNMGTHYAIYWRDKGQQGIDKFQRQVVHRESRGVVQGVCRWSFLCLGDVRPFLP